MFISVLDLFKIGVGPSSSHTMGPMVAARDFRSRCAAYIAAHQDNQPYHVRCTLKGSLAFTGKGHATDRAVILGLNNFTPQELAKEDVNQLIEVLSQRTAITFDDTTSMLFSPMDDVVFDKGEPLPEHPNGMIFQLMNAVGKTVLTETYFSIGGGFITTLADIKQVVAPIKVEPAQSCGYPFENANQMMRMSAQSGLSIAAMKRSNEQERVSPTQLDAGLDAIWHAMRTCIQKGLAAEGILPGGLKVKRRAKALYHQLQENTQKASMNDWLCAYAMAVNEENAAGHMVVTAPTNGAAGVIPAVIYYAVQHEGATPEQVREFLLVAAAIGGLIKHNSSISGAEVGCQGEVGSASAMAAAGLCAIKGGTTAQIENAAEIALEHHLGMTCDPVGSLVQVPCIERNGFGAIKAYTAASLAIRGDGQHFMSLDNCIAAMKQTGLEMSVKFKETSLGGLAVSITEC